MTTSIDAAREAADIALCTLRQEIGSREAEAVRDLIHAVIADTRFVQVETTCQATKNTMTAAARPSSSTEGLEARRDIAAANATSPSPGGGSVDEVDYESPIWVAIRRLAQVMVEGSYGSTETEIVDREIAALCAREYQRGYDDAVKQVVHGPDAPEPRPMPSEPSNQETI